MPSKPVTPMPAHDSPIYAMLPQKVRATLRREFTKFFVYMTTPEKNWPSIPHQEFVNALADSLVAMGKDKGIGVAYLQTLVHELQDRINIEVDSKKG